MNKKKIKIYLIITLLLIECLTLSLTYKSYGNKILDNKKEEYEVDKETFSMYVESLNEDGTSNYEEYNDSNVFPTGYKINLEKSKCTDTKGNLINGILSGRGNKVTITSNKTTYCYVYFDIDYNLSELCTSGDNLGSCLTTNNEEIDSLGDTAYSGMYRYTGTNDIVDDNYICFGTDDKDTCINNPETYMYRIIGVTSEANDTLGLETNQLKLIKYTSIDDDAKWNDDGYQNVLWPNSTIFYNINGDGYLTNSTYMPNGWSNKIDNVKWNIGDVAVVGTSEDRDEIYSMDIDEIYLLESSNVTSDSSKIGLIYLTDFMLAYNGKIQNCPNKICNSWLTSGKNEHAWTMTRYGIYGTNDSGSPYYTAWSILVENKIRAYYGLNGPLAAIPVFYLNSDEQYISGDGTIDNPIIISGPIMHTVNVSSNNTTYGIVIPTTQEVVDTGNATITISPNTGYKYSSNTCGVELVDNVITINNVTSDKECTVTFEPNKYTVSVTSTNTSYGTVSPASQSISHGSNATITLSPASGYKYSSNTCGGTVSGNTMTISNITANKSCTITFVAKIYSCSEGTLSGTLCIKNATKSTTCNTCITGFNTVLAGTTSGTVSWDEDYNAKCSVDDKSIDCELIYDYCDFKRSYNDIDLYTCPKTIEKADCSVCGSTYSYNCPSGWSEYSGSGSTLKCSKSAVLS